MKKSHLLALLAVMLPSTVHAEGISGRDAMGTPVLSSVTLPKGLMGAFYDYGHTEGQGAKGNTHVLTLGVWQPVSKYSTQYWLLTGNKANFKNSGGTSDNDTDGLGFTYGRTHYNPLIGLSYYYSGHAGFANSEYNSDGKHSNSMGLTVGATHTTPLSQTDALSIGLGLDFSYLKFADSLDDEDGFAASLFPSVQYNRILAPDLTGFVRAAANLSTRDVAISGVNGMFTPAFGVNYTYNQDLRFGAQYTREIAHDHQGDHVGLTLTRPF